MELASCYTSGTYNFEVAPKFLENLGMYLLCSVTERIMNARCIYFRMMDMVLTGLTCHQPYRDIYSTVEISLCSPSGPHRLHHCSQSTGYVLL
jgi:hypothetical protein